MDKKDRIKLRVLSNIADDIIERNSQKRFLLMSMMGTSARKPSRNNKIKMISAIAAIALVAALSVFLILQLIGIGKQVPVYLGMSVHQTKSAALASADGQHVLLDASGDLSGGTTAETTEETTTEGAKELPVTFDEMYYATAGQEAYVKIHFENPDDYEILSFTLGGKKYASHMFEDGSDMENLIVKIDIPADAEGIFEYTIDAIKYVDGTSIKDVRMEGDDTVRIGVKTLDQPTVKVTREEVGLDYMYLEMTVEDKKNLIAKTKGNAQVILYDASGTAVSAVLIKANQENMVRFENLGRGRAYTYKVVFAYDNLSGVGFQSKTFASNTLVTEDYLLSDFTIETEGVSYRLTWNKAVKNGTLESLALYDGNTLLRTLSTDMEGALTDLLSNHTYRLEATVKLDGESYSVRKNVTTKAKTIPNLSVILDEVTTESISIYFEKYDPDGILRLDEVLFYQTGKGLVKKLENVSTDEEIIFDGLLSAAECSIVCKYSYDLNDGTGVKTLDLTEPPVRTKKKQGPTISIEQDTCSPNSISFALNIVDPDETVTLQKLELLRDGAVVKTADSFDVRAFEGLPTEYAEYEICLTYLLDFNRGTGAFERTLKQECYTTPIVTLSNVSTVNASGLQTGDAFSIAATVTVPEGVHISSAVINGKSYAVEFVGNMLSVRITTDAAFGTGNVTCVIEKLCYTGKYSERFEIVSSGSTSVACYVNKPLTVSGIRAVDRDGNDVYVTSTTDEIYYLIACDNSQGYTITSVVINGTTCTNIAEVTATYIKVAAQELAVGGKAFLRSITYECTTMAQSTKSFDPAPSCDVYVIQSNNVVEIWTVNDLLGIKNNTSSGQIYRLMADIDLSNVQVENFGTLRGWFDGNGHTISNFTLQGTYENTDVYVGLFKDCAQDETVIVSDLKLEGVSVQVMLSSNEENHIYYGGVIADAGAGNALIWNVSHSGSVVLVNSSDGYCYMGGMIGRSTATNPMFLNCTNNANMQSNVSYAGGIAGYVQTSADAKFINCVNTGNVETSIYSGDPFCGVRSKNFTFENCTDTSAT